MIKKLKSAYSYYSHRSIHKERKHKCSFCDKKFQSKSHAVKHEIVNHKDPEDTQAKWEACDKCLKTL